MNKNKFKFLLPLLVPLLATYKLWFKEGTIFFGEFQPLTNALDNAKLLFTGWTQLLGFGFSSIGFPESIGGGLSFGTIPQSSNLFWLIYRGLLNLVFGHYADLVYICLGLVLPFYAAYFFLKHIVKSSFKYYEAAIYWASFFYIVNPQTLLRTAIGEVRYNYGHTLLPLALLFWHRLIEQNNSKKDFWWLVLCLGLIAIIIPHYLVLFTAYWLIYSIYLAFNKKKDSFKKSVLLGLAALSSSLLLIIAPIVSNKLYPPDFLYPTSRYFSLNSLLLNSKGAQLLDMARLAPNSFIENSPTYIQYLLWLLPVLAIVGFIGYRQKSETSRWLWLTVFIMALIFSTGPNWPLGSFKEWFFLNIPGMSAFRDPGKITEMYLLAMTVLLAHSFIYLFKKLEQAKISLAVLFIAILLLPNIGYLNGNLKNQIDLIKIPTDYQQAPNGRVAIFPFPSYINQMQWHKDQVSKNGGTAAEIPWAFNRINHQTELVSNATPNDNRSYRLVRYWNDATDPELKKWLQEKTATELVMKAEGYSVSTQSTMPGLPKIVTSNKLVVIDGDWPTLGQFYKNIPAELPFIFSYDLPWQNMAEVFSDPGTILLSNNKERAINNYVLNSFLKEKQIPLTKYFWNQLGVNNEWLYTDITATTPEGSVSLISKNSFIVPAGSSQFIPLEREIKENLIVAARVVPDSWPVQIKINEQNITTNSNEQAAASWLVTVINKEDLQNKGFNFTNSNGFKIILDGLIALPKTEYEQRLSEAKSIIKPQIIVNELGEISDGSFNNFDLQKVGLNEYKITPEPEANSWLQIKYSYNPYWRLGDSEPLIADGYSQLYRISNNRESNWHFIPTKTVIWLNVINLLLFIVVAFLALRSRKRN